MAAIANPSTIAVESNLNASNYGRDPFSSSDPEVESFTTPLTSDITDYKVENGRRYHAYKKGSYYYPNDQQEIERLDIMHKMIEVSLGGKLHRAPIGKGSQRILDIGTGTGSWAIEIVKVIRVNSSIEASIQILGNDLSPIQPHWVPPNVRFEVDDAEADWTYSQKFDYIHCRCMGNAIYNWPRLVQQCFEFTKPGCWTEFVDLDFEYTSPDGSLTPKHAIKIFNSEFLRASRAANVEPCPGPRLEGWAKEAGFIDLHHEKIVLPIGTWPADKHLKKVGAWNKLQISSGLEAFTYALFTRKLGYSVKEVEVVCSKIRAELQDPAIHSMIHL
ncbi:hypothetical protein MMC12_000697 [Toensbergia leucococca]|nr:hypothetical protein [Toensbergia leucococca]